MFVGSERLSVVDRLVTTFDELRHTCTPRMIALVASPGWGKTRIVQEFYARLAAVQPAPGYWSPSLVDSPDAASATFVDVTTSRKVVRHRRLTVPADTVPPWLWLAPASSRLGDGSCGPALESVADQLAPHLGTVLQAIAARGALDDSILAAVAAAVPLRHLVNLSPITPELSQRLLRLSVDRIVPGTAELTAGLGNAFAALLRAAADGLGGDRLGVVVVLDDAHDLDRATVDFVTEILSGSVPVLFVATTWPDPPGGDAMPSPFTAYLAEAADAERVHREVLARLDPDDLVDYVRAQFPETDPGVAFRLAQRADGNPYALRLLLDTPRVRSATGNGRIVLDADEIESINGGLDSLLREHWARLTAGVQQTLATAAMLGQSFVDDVLLSALEALDTESGSGLAEALASAWIRPAGEPVRVIEFIERIRYELARDAVVNVLSPKVRELMLHAALRTVRRLLDSSDKEYRQTLLALHVGLAQDGAEPDLVRAAQSAGELADIAREQHRRAEAIRYLDRAIEWLEKGDDVEPSMLAGFYTALAENQVLELSRARSEPAALRAREIATAGLGPHDEVRLHAQLAVFRAWLRRDDPEVFQRAIDLLHEIEANLPQEPSPLLVRSLWAAQRNVLSLEGAHEDARRRAGELVAFCEEHLGTHNRWTLDSMEQTAFQAVRCNDLDEAVRVRRAVLSRRIDTIPVTGRMPAALAQHNLASVLARLGDDQHLAEAEEHAEAVLATWSRVYGMTTGRSCMARLIRARVWQQQGLSAEKRGDEEVAADLYRRAAGETAAVLELRAGALPASRAIALMRHGWSLAATRDRQGVTLLRQALAIRENDLCQDHTFWVARECAGFLVWAYQRFGLELEAESVIRRYQLTG
ncbi:AAA family ATPase [Actinoplanes sp. NPDC089786]|uniref:AAA family ATPase n=1 Tax=Actinoplanes sp. NPDC089786 TaxID=3155185 RepID=UPI003440362F